MMNCILTKFALRQDIFRLVFNIYNKTLLCLLLKLINGFFQASSIDTEEICDTEKNILSTTVLNNNTPATIFASPTERILGKKYGVNTDYNIEVPKKKVKTIDRRTRSFTPSKGKFFYFFLIIATKKHSIYIFYNYIFQLTR